MQKRDAHCRNKSPARDTGSSDCGSRKVAARRQSERNLGTAGGHDIERTLRIIALEAELKVMKERLNDILYYIDTEDLRAIGRIEKATPSLAKLRVLAAHNPPPAAWFDDDDD